MNNPRIVERDAAFYDEVTRFNAAIKAGAKVRIKQDSHEGRSREMLIKKVRFEEDGEAYGRSPGERAYWLIGYNMEFHANSSLRVWPDLLAQAGVTRHPYFTKKQEKSA